jgi:hypothetical protein
VEATVILAPPVQLQTGRLAAACTWIFTSLWLGDSDNGYFHSGFLRPINHIFHVSCSVFISKSVPFKSLDAVITLNKTNDSLTKLNIISVHTPQSKIIL